VDVPGSEFVEPADSVLVATGQFPDTDWIDKRPRKALVGEDQWLKSGRAQTTALAQVFVAGDFATGASTLIDAIGHARTCAREVDAFLMKRERLEDVVQIEDGRDDARSREMDDIPRQPMPALPLTERGIVTEVETGFDQDTSVTEARRCYLCHYKYEIDMTRCIYCDQCVEVKPRPNCIVKTRALVKDEEGRITGWEPAQEDLRKATEHIYWVHQEDCIRCNACLEVCPVDCISVQKVSRAVRARATP
jgi:NAD-dependent dihydropyrimidine dehydrogenase PreA subunit